jgi:Ca2+-binding EF-hand superfamily protein
MRAVWLLFALPAALAFGAAPPAPADAGDAHDLVLLHPARPYRVRLHLRVAGRPFAERWDAQVAGLLAFLDANGDGVLGKAEAAAAPSREQWQQLSAGVNPIDPDAAPAFAELARGKPAATLADLRAYYAASSAGPLQVRWAAASDATRRLSADLFERLDVDRDGVLSAAELKAAPAVLRRLDANDDEMITPNEVTATGYFEPAGPAFVTGAPTGPAAGGSPFYSLRPGEGAAPLARLLAAQYAGTKNAPPPSGWLRRPPDLEVSAELAGGPAEIRLTPGRRPGVRVQHRHGELTAAAGDWRVAVRLGARPAPPPRAPAAARALFRTLDADRSGWLESAEVQKPPFTYVSWLRLADRDGDGRVSEKEFVAFAALQQQVRGSMAFVRVVDHGQSLWHLLDSNRDGRLGLREIRDAAKRLGPAGRPPRQFEITLSYGHNPPPGEGARAHPLPPRGPVWFRKMDRNRDGDVSPAEWLGTAEQFRAIDADGDGLISAGEAERFDRAKRKVKDK